MPQRRSSNPVPASWEPEAQVDPTPQQERQERTIDPHGREWHLQSRAVAIVRRLYGIAPGDFSRWDARCDRAALAVYRKLMNGEELPEYWRSQHREPPPINALDWITPRQSNR